MSKKDNGDLPPPLTRKSSRAEMWENIEAMGQEIDRQQKEIKQYRQMLNESGSRLAVFRGEMEAVYRCLDVIRAVLPPKESP